MEAMTLEQVRDRLRTDSAYWEKKGGARTVQARLLRTYADAIDARLAQPAQAVDVGADFGAMNRALCDFAMRWEIDGDYMRCLKCRRPQITNYASHNFPHSADCKAAGNVEARPWETFAQLLSPLTRALSGEKAVPVGDREYRLLGPGDVIEPDDEFIHDNAVDWVPLKTNPGAAQLFAGMQYRLGTLKQARRPLPASPTPDKEGEG